MVLIQCGTLLDKNNFTKRGKKLHNPEAILDFATKNNSLYFSLKPQIMRTMKAVLVTATLGVSSLLVGESAFATDAVTVSTNNTDKKLKVQVVEPRLQDISVHVADLEGKIIYQEDIRARTTYGKVYDLTALEDGVYTFTSDGEYISTTRKIQVEGSTAREISEEATYKPVITLENNYLKVNYFNQNKEDLEFSIEGIGATYHESSGGNEIAYGKMLDVSRMPPGKYYAKLKVGNKEYYQSFERR
jgi:hypothetical protein